MASEEDNWYTNISKNDKGIDVNVMDLFEKEIKEITASSNNTINILKNIADNNPLTQWSTRYETITLDDDFYVDRKVTKGGYSRGSIVKDGSNKQNVNDYLMGIYQSRDAVQSNYNGEINALKQKEENNKIDSEIRELEAKFTSELNNLNSKISNKQEYINNLPFKVRDDGKYTGNKQTILTNGSIIKGEWIDIILKSKLLINKYELLPGKREENGNLKPFPKDFYLLGTNNNKWEIIDSHFDYTPVYYDDNTPIPFTLKNKKRYERIRLVISSLNPSNINYNGLGSLSLSIFNLYGNKCYTVNKFCETFQPYINKKNMSKIEGLTMMDENIQVLEDLKQFSEKYNKYITCSDITLPENIRAGCSDEDKNIDTVNNAYNKLTTESITKLQNTPLNNFSTVAEYETTHNEIIKKHKEIVPLRKELDEKLRQLNAEEESMLNDYKLKYDNTMYTSLVLSVVLTSSLYFIFRKI